MKKSAKRNSKKIILSNRWLYTLITVGILICLSVGVYAVLGTTPNPGHSISELQTCSNGEILQMVNGAWACTTAQTSGICPTGTHMYYEYFNGGEDYDPATGITIVTGTKVDTCQPKEGTNGVINARYGGSGGYACGINEVKSSCTDIWYDYPNYNSQQVFCKRNMNVNCLEN